jgi:hypothetical protein
LIPSAANPSILYKVAIGRQCDLRTLTACNQSTATTIKISVRMAGAAASSEQFLYYEYALSQNATLIHGYHTMLTTADEVWVESASGLVSFNAFGEEEFV